MRLIYLFNVRLPTEKAHAYQALKMCEAFASSGVDVTLYHAFRVQPAQMRNVTDVFAFYHIRNDFSIHTLPSFDLLWLAKGRCTTLAYRLQAITFSLAVLIKSVSAWGDPGTVFYSRDPFSSTLLLCCRPFVRAKLVFEAHRFIGQSRTWLLSLFRDRLDLLIVITQQLKRLYTEAGVPAEKIVVAPDAVDLGQFRISDGRQECRRRLGLPLDRPIVGYVGRFRTMGMEKGIPELVEAIKYLLHTCAPPPLLLCVGGPMECVPSYEALARQHGIPLAHLRFVDRVPNSQVPYWMRACDVCTIPWPWTEFSAYYTSPLKLFEYMAVGAPIVASDLPSLREVLRHKENAILVAPGDPVSLAKGIHSVLKDQELAARIAGQGAVDVVQYTWEKRARRILSRIRAIHATG